MLVFFFFLLQHINRTRRAAHRSCNALRAHWMRSCCAHPVLCVCASEKSIRPLSQAIVCRRGGAHERNSWYLICWCIENSTLEMHTSGWGRGKRRKKFTQHSIARRTVLSLSLHLPSWAVARTVEFMLLLLLTIIIELPSLPAHHHSVHQPPGLVKKDVQNLESIPRQERHY